MTYTPELIDTLAAAYALGTLKGGARRRFEALARTRADVRGAAQRWQARLASIALLQPGLQPSEQVWKRVHNLVQAEIQLRQLAAQRERMQQPQTRADAEQTSASARLLRWWRGGAIAGVVASVMLLAVALRLNHQLQTQPVVQYVAVLSDDKSAASMLVTFDPKSRQLTLQRVSSFAEGENQSLQLWALPEGRGPQSLGVLPRDRVIKLTAAQDVKAVPLLAVSLEQKGGSPNPNAPTGPVIFKGQVIQRQL
jgi:anti-sigma-K factor RskA